MAPVQDKKERRGANAERRQRRASMADSATQEDQCHPRKIFIGGLSSATTTQDLRGHFSRFGGIADAVVLQWPDGRSRGFGYVTFADASASMAALRTQHVVGGRPVDVKRAVPGTNKLFVGGMPQNATAAELREHFEAYGVVSDAVVMIDPATGRSRGFGFVCFCPGQEGSMAMNMALEQYQSHRIRGKWIEVKSAAPPHKLGAQEQTDIPMPDAAATAAAPALLGAPLWPPAAPEAFAAPGTLLPQVIRPAWLGEPHKVALPGQSADEAKAAELIGTPPGLEGTPPGFDGMVTPRMRWAPGPERVGPVPWPCASAAAALPPAPWSNLLSMAFDDQALELPAVMPATGAFAYNEWDARTAQVDDEQDVSEGLQKSLEQLLKLRLNPDQASGPSAAPGGA